LQRAKVQFKKQERKWNAFKEVIAKFMGNYKYPDYKQIAEKMLEKIIALVCAMSLNVLLVRSKEKGFIKT
jgi:hypothetical protein